jgi:hypothetical protein
MKYLFMNIYFLIVKEYKIYYELNEDHISLSMFVTDIQNIKRKNIIIDNLII